MRVTPRTMTPDGSMSPTGDKKHNLFDNETLKFFEKLNKKQKGF